MGDARVPAWGAPDGAPCVYFHGAPGGPAECAGFDAAAQAAGVRLLAPDRWTMAPGSDGDRYFAALAADVERMAGGRPATLVGFSVGAFVAVEVAARMATPPSAVHLVSPAAPLAPGDLDVMAGGPVFRMAQRAPALFATGTALQGLLVRVAPGAVIRALFGSATGREAALAADPRFRETVTHLMRRAYGPCRAGYVRDIRLYVGPWGESFARLAAPPAIWQGTEDTWTPPTMARRIAALAPGPPRLTLLPGLAHYSTLFEAVPRILAEVGAAAA